MKIVSTEKFFRKMACKAFLRISPSQGLLYGELYYTLIPPEEAGYFDTIVDEIKECLK